MESLYLRTGDELYRVLAKRWSKVMIALFAIGVVTGTILSFEMGLLWPNFMATFGDVFGLAFGLEGFSFFVEAIFIAIYVYSWDRVSTRTHLLCGVPVVLAGLTGSLFVISVNALDEPPGRLPARRRPRDRRPSVEGAVRQPATCGPSWRTCTSPASSSPASSWRRPYAWGWLKGRRGRYERVALAVPLTIAALAAPVQLLVGDWIARRVDRGPADEARGDRRARADDQGRRASTCSAGTRTARSSTGSRSRRACRCWPSTTRTPTIQGLDAVPPDDRPPVNVVRIAFQMMVGIGTLLALLGVVHLVTWFRRRRFLESRWFLWALVAAGPLSVVALDRRLGDDRGRPPAVGGLRRHAHTEAVTGAGGIPVGYATLVVVYLALAVAVAWILRAAAAQRRSTSRRRRRRSSRLMALADVPADPDPGRHRGLHRARRRGLRRGALVPAGRAAGRGAAGARLHLPRDGARSGRPTTSG